MSLRLGLQLFFADSVSLSFSSRISLEGSKDSKLPQYKYIFFFTEMTDHLCTAVKVTRVGAHVAG